MPRPGLLYEDVSKAATALLKEKKEIPLLREVREYLETTASDSTLSKHVKAWEKQRILMSIEHDHSKQTLTDGNISQHFEEIWHTLNQKREQKFQQEQQEKETIIAELKAQVETAQAQLTDQQMMLQDFQKKCEGYQLNELKQSMAIKNMTHDRDRLQAQLQQAENMIPALREETQRHLKHVQEHYHKTLQDLQIHQQLLETQLEKNSLLMQEQWGQTLTEFQNQKKLDQKIVADLKNELSLSQTQVLQLKVENQSLQMKEQAFTEQIRHAETLKKVLEEQIEKMGAQQNQCLQAIARVEAQLQQEASRSREADHPLQIMRNEQRWLVKQVEEVVQQIAGVLVLLNDQRPHG